MEYGENDEAQDGVAKWPFYLSAFFIVGLVLGFAYLHLEKDGVLDQWQITTCILASALASILVFIPHLLDRFLYLVFDPANRKDEELHRKTYFDIKEMRGDLETLAVKVDKVPSVVDKILSDSFSPDSDKESILGRLSSELEETKEELLEKFRALQEITEQSPLLPEPDPAIAQANESIKKLGVSLKGLAEQVESLQATVDQIPTEIPQTVQALPDEIAEEEPAEQEEEDPAIPEPEEETPEEDEPEPEAQEETGTPEEEDPETDENEEAEIQIPDEEILEEEAGEDFEEEVTDEPDDEEGDDEDGEPREDDSEPPEDPVTESVGEEGGEELALDLPAPEETLRKVDALLADEAEKAPAVEPTEEAKPKSTSGGTTSVIANVMIGIGNKPYLRGEGAGLDWDEGVPMNFIEIGKWAWTPPRKNAALTVQLFRNDEEPDKGGKIEVKSGEQIEITPDFS